MSTTRELQLAAALLSGSIIASRILGFVREMVLAALMGAGAETDAYLAAFVVPDVINHFLAGGALSTALLPIFAARIVGGRDEDGWRLVTTVIRLAIGVLLVALVIAGVAAEPLIRLWYPGFDAEQVQLTAHLTRIVLPGPVFFTVGALLNATEQARKRFVATALMPLVYNVCIILGGVLGHRSLGVAGFSWGVLVGAFLGPFLVAAIASWDAARLREGIPWDDPDVRRFLSNAAPILVSSSLIFFDEWIGRRFASELDHGAITWLNNARRLMLVPAMLVGQAIGQAAFPFLSRLRHEGDESEIGKTLAGVLRGTAALAVVSAAGLYVTADAGVRVVYQRGAYTATDADVTAALVAMLAFAVPGWAVYTVALRTVHAAERMWLSSGIGFATLVPSWFVYRTLGASHGVEGLAAATGICITGAAAAMLVASQAAWRRSPWPPVVRGLAEGALSGALGIAAGLAVDSFSPPLPQAVRLLAVGGAFGAAALVGLLAVGGPASGAVRRRLLRRR